MATLQVKGMDAALYEALQARARQDHRTVSQEVTMMIQEFLVRPGPSPRVATEAFLAMAGTWGDDRPAESIVKELRAARRGGRRARRLGDVFD
ncbi:MAG: antitoxin [Candidatus Sumerlaeota bacterium]|nr:antitoxin [Candidatus Sumerlaeota bacterium]